MGRIAQILKYNGSKVAIHVQRHRARRRIVWVANVCPSHQQEPWDFVRLKDEICRACDWGFAWLEPPVSPFRVPAHGSYHTNITII